MNAATTFQTIRNWFTGQQADPVQRPMAILRDASQAYKSDAHIAATPPPQPAARPCSAAARLALRQARQAQLSLSPMPLQLVPAPLQHAPARLYAAAGTPALQTGARPHPLPAATPDRLYLSGKLADVCQQLEQLVAQEEHFLRLG